MHKLTVKETLACCVAGLVAVGCATLTSPFSEPDERWANYKSWTKITEGNPSTGPSPALGTVHMGPEGYREIFANDTALEMITGDGPYDFPAGSVIVKEQYASREDWEAGRDVDVTVSLKVADSPGTPVEDWRWAAGFKEAAEVSDFCAGCHHAAIAFNNSDFVFSVPKYLAAE